MDVAIIQYNAGNICSVVNAFRRLGIEPILTADPLTLSQASHIVFPGQGEAGTTMAFIREKGLDNFIKSLRQPFLGICIGMQLMCRHSEEEDTDCLGIFDVDVCRFKPLRHEDKVPQMGWNTILNLKSPLFNNVESGSYTYFIHSYYAPVCQYTIASTEYILPYSSALHKDNYYATQFHPEKSGKIGEQIIRNFLEI